jgi:hypothetical protein
MYPITAAHSENPTFVKRWIDAPALAELITESFRAMEAAIAEGDPVTTEALRSLYATFSLRSLKDRGVGNLSLLLGRLDKEVRQFVLALESEWLFKGVHLDFYSMRKELNWYQESYNPAYWMTLNRDTVNALDFARSCVKDSRHIFVDNLFLLARSEGRFEVITALLGTDDIEFQGFQATYCRDADFDFGIEKNWLTHLVGLGIERKGIRDTSQYIWAHSVCDTIERTAGEGRHLEHTASRLMFEVLESFPEETRSLACESMKLGLATQVQGGYVNTELYDWCDFEHYFGMSAGEAAMQVHAGTLTMDWKHRFLLSLLEDTADKKSVTKHWSGRDKEFRVIALADDLKHGGQALESHFYDFVETAFAVIANDHEIGTILLLSGLSDTWKTITDLPGAYLRCMHRLFGFKDKDTEDINIKFHIDSIKANIDKSFGFSRAFFAIGSMLGQNNETMNFFENLVERYSVSPAFLHEISGLDKELMCKNIKFAASIFSKDLGL